MIVYTPQSVSPTDPHPRRVSEYGHPDIISDWMSTIVIEENVYKL